MRGEGARLMKPSNLHAVAFVGIDGSGKSTQARTLADRLRERGAVVVAVHPYGSKLLRPLASGRPEPARRQRLPTVDGRSRAAPAIALADFAEMAAYLWLNVLRARIKAIVAPQRQVWIIGDRSFDDVIAKHRRRRALPPVMLDRVRKLAPKFATTILLDVAPQVAFKRDADFALSYYESAASLYRKAAREHGYVVLDVTGADRDEVFHEVVRLLERGL
jgi:thymidylate kinase